MVQQRSNGAIGFWEFWLYWIIAHGLIWLASQILILFGVNFLTLIGLPLALVLFIVNMATFALPGAWIAFTQRVLIRFRFGLYLNDWRRYSAAGWLAGGALFALLTPLAFTATIPSTLIFALVFTVPALAQWRVLRRTIKQRAWLWVLANIVAGILFTLPIETALVADSGLLLMGAGVLQGAVTGILLHQIMVESQQAARKRKTGDAAMANLQTIDPAVERLIQNEGRPHADEEPYEASLTIRK